MDIESSSSSCYDSLKAFDGSSTTAMLIATLCGSTVPDPVYSTANEMYLQFESDGSVTKAGFKALVKFVDPSVVPTEAAAPTTGCGSVHTDPTGTIMTPNYPNDYPNSADCDTTIISQDRNAKVTLTFDNFETELSGNCQYDYVLIYDGADSSFPFMDRFCGSVIPGPITSTGPDMYIKFVSDYSVGASGISATYTSA
ncbi:putative deleted in malignant brain tumors 1 protein [Apostichopus japonicus]|uniref:Putative deleted in malignant brain tumors 1 protein n=1 Tax=Stichopus japonicus TaxID=307972 RepID=A0A2G8K2T6_STIJA|nr:putative deleted in malignant brain tumors 1 protein [Apostichopus japonicus]